MCSGVPRSNTIGKTTAHDADRRAFRRSTAAFFLSPRDRLLETEGAVSLGLLDPAGSGVMLAAQITLPYFSISLAMNTP